MARYRGPKQKIARRYRAPLFGFSKALDRKNYAPGQHGRTRRQKLSDYGIQLMEKQKCKYIYGLLERQFRKTFHEAARRRGSTGDNLMALLESRLDNAVFRMGFGNTRRAARQLVNHKHIRVNGRVVNVPSYLCRPGDTIEVRERSKSLEVVNDALKNSNARKFSWIEVDRNSYSGKFLYYPERADIPEPVEERLIVELYSR